MKSASAITRPRKMQVPRELSVARCSAIAARLRSGRLLVGPLRQQGDERNDRDAQCDRRSVSTERKAALIQRLVKEIANGCAERAGQNERRPEQDRARYRS